MQDRTKDGGSQFEQMDTDTTLTNDSKCETSAKSEIHLMYKISQGGFDVKFHTISNPTSAPSSLYKSSSILEIIYAVGQLNFCILRNEKSVGAEQQ